MIVYIRDRGKGMGHWLSTSGKDRFYRASVSAQWARRHDNGALVSCGLTVPESLSRRSLGALRFLGRLSEIGRSEWVHSSCSSSCTRRGDAACQW